MKTRVLFFLLSILMVGACKKNDPKPSLTTVSGTVTDKNGLLEGVSISYKYSEDGATGSANPTYSKGNFRIENLNSGFCTFTFIKEGYEKYDHEININIDPQPVPLNVIMKELSGFLKASPDYLEFNTGEDRKTILLENTQKQGTISFSIATTNDAEAWLKIDKTTGTVSNANAIQFTVSVVRNGLGYGNYIGNIVVNGGGNNLKIPVTLNIANPNAPSVSISKGSIAQTSAEFLGTVLTVGGSQVVERGHVWAEFENPTLESNIGVTKKGPGGVGSFPSLLSNLTPGKTYYIRAYATNANGTGYSLVEKFTTLTDASKPTIGINNITEINTNSASVYGIATADGGKPITEMGIVYGVGTTPTLTDNKKTVTVNVGTEFKVPLTGLTPGVTYFVRAFATNSVGTEYSAARSFTTQSQTTGTNNFSTLPFSSMVLIKGGTFEMGDSRGDGNNLEKPVHTVTLSDYYMAQYEITQKHWKEIMGDNLSFNQNCDDCPVEQVNSVEIQVFLTELNKRTGKKYRLPTEAEWEYAAGGGSGTRFRFGNGKNIADPKEMNISPLTKQVYSVDGENRKKTIKVGSFAPNTLGLYDMTGNVAEWCSDYYEVYKSFAQTNPTGPASGTSKIIRGGGWDSGPYQSRITYRSNLFYTTRDKAVGFRIVLAVE